MKISVIYPWPVVNTDRRIQDKNIFSTLQEKIQRSGWNKKTFCFQFFVVVHSLLCTCTDAMKISLQRGPSNHHCFWNQQAGCKAEGKAEFV